MPGVWGRGGAGGGQDPGSEGRTGAGDHGVGGAGNCQSSWKEELPNWALLAEPLDFRRTRALGQCELGPQAGFLQTLASSWCLETNKTLMGLLSSASGVPSPPPQAVGTVSGAEPVGHCSHGAPLTGGSESSCTSCNSAHLSENICFRHKKTIPMFVPESTSKLQKFTR